MIVRISSLAGADLEEIGDWIAPDNPIRAASFVDQLVDRCLGLAQNPRQFPAIRRPGGNGIRKLSWRGYLIFYRVREAEVEIVRIVHGSRDWVTLLGEASPGAGGPG